jgi:hypothetical protein
MKNATSHLPTRSPDRRSPDGDRRSLDGDRSGAVAAIGVPWKESTDTAFFLLLRDVRQDGQVTNFFLEVHNQICSQEGHRMRMASFVIIIRHYVSLYKEEWSYLYFYQTQFLTKLCHVI